jgi:hypothetical protein
MDYYILDKGNVSIMQKDNALYNNIKDNPYLRLSELIKDINEQLNINEKTITDSPEMIYDITNFSLLYDLNNKNRLEEIFAIIGRKRIGNNVRAIYKVYDIDKIYTLTFFVYFGTFDIDKRIEYKIEFK